MKPEYLSFAGNFAGPYAALTPEGKGEVLRLGEKFKKFAASFKILFHPSVVYMEAAAALAQALEISGEGRVYCPDEFVFTAGVPERAQLTFVRLSALAENLESGPPADMVIFLAGFPVLLHLLEHFSGQRQIMSLGNLQKLSRGKGVLLNLATRETRVVG